MTFCSVKYTKSWPLLYAILMSMKTWTVAYLLVRYLHPSVKSKFHPSTGMGNKKLQHCLYWYHAEERGNIQALVEILSS